MISHPRAKGLTLIKGRGRAAAPNLHECNGWRRQMPLTRKQLEEFEGLLRQRRQDLVTELLEDVARARDESFADVAGSVTDPGDEAIADLLSDLDNAEVARDMRTVRDLEAALARIADGSYGTCADCGEDIGLQRLRAYPTALRCIKCQEVHEKTYVHPGEPRL
jgi:RNA polymerase-binding protein DksA